MWKYIEILIVSFVFSTGFAEAHLTGDTGDSESHFLVETGGGGNGGGGGGGPYKMMMRLETCSSVDFSDVLFMSRDGEYCIVPINHEKESEFLDQISITLGTLGGGGKTTFRL